MSDRAVYCSRGDGRPLDGSGWPGNGDELLCQECWEADCAESFWRNRPTSRTRTGITGSSGGRQRRWHGRLSLPYERGDGSLTPTLDEMDVHTFFGLTYCNYLVLHRSLLQSMPEEWQHRFVAVVREFEDAFDHVERAKQYRVNAIDPETGRFVTDPVPHYNRGRTYVEPRLV